MAVSGNAPATLDLYVRQSSDLAVTFAVQLDAVDYDFTGATVTAKVLDGSGREQTSVTWAVTTATGELVLALSAAETALIRTGWRWYLDVTKASLTQPWLAGALIPVAPGFAGPTSTTVSLSLATGDGHALSISADPGQGLAAHVAAADPHPGYVLESVLTTAGDLLTRGASAPDRVTRASLAQDTAFSSRYVLLATADRVDGEGPVWDAGAQEWVSAAGGGGGLTAEQVRDTIGATLVAGSNVTITVDDPGDTITIAASGGGSSDPLDGNNIIAARVFAR